MDHREWRRMQILQEIEDIKVRNQFDMFRIGEIEHNGEVIESNLLKKAFGQLIILLTLVMLLNR